MRLEEALRGAQLLASLPLASLTPQPPARIDRYREASLKFLEPCQMYDYLCAAVGETFSVFRTRMVVSFRRSLRGQGIARGVPMKMNEDSSHTSRLLEAASEGDRVAVDELIAAYRGYLHKLVNLRMDHELRVRVDPSDVVQETQFIASQRIDDFLKRRPTSFRIWLRRKALERLIDLRRRHVFAEKRSVRREFTLSDRSSMAMAQSLLTRPPSEQVHKHQLAEQVRIAIGRMKASDREVLLLRHVEGLNNVEAAEFLGMDPNAASQRYGRALRRLREALIQQGFFDDE